MTQDDSTPPVFFSRPRTVGRLGQGGLEHCATTRSMACSTNYGMQYKIWHAEQKPSQESTPTQRQFPCTYPQPTHSHTHQAAPQVWLDLALKVHL